MRLTTRTLTLVLFLFAMLTTVAFGAPTIERGVSVTSADGTSYSAGKYAEVRLEIRGYTSGQVVTITPPSGWVGGTGASDNGGASATVIGGTGSSSISITPNVTYTGGGTPIRVRYPVTVGSDAVTNPQTFTVSEATVNASLAGVEMTVVVDGTGTVSFAPDALVSTGYGLSGVSGQRVEMYYTATQTMSGGRMEVTIPYDFGKCDAGLHCAYV